MCESLQPEEKAVQMHQQHHGQLEMLRTAKLAEAINQLLV